MPKAQQARRPISCHFCRSRKLRCSREAPCSNCVSRGLRCDLDNPTQTSPELTGATESETVERIRKLEKLVQDLQTQQNGNEEKTTNNSTAQEQAPRQPTRVENLDDDVAWLQSICCVSEYSNEIPSDRAVFRTCSISQISETNLYVNQDTLVSTTILTPTKCVWLPLHHEAKVLLEKYVQDIDYIHHIVHLPSLPTILDEFYASMRQHGQVKSGNAILLLGIFASATYSWVQGDYERGLFSSSSEANNQSSLWLKTIEHVFDIAHRTTRISLEGIQGLLIALFVMKNMEGLSRRCLSIYYMAIPMARELGLHRIDHPSNAKSVNSIDAEMGRRVWWYLVSSDWYIAARFSNITQGTYQCHMRQMAVKKPLNLNDEDLRDCMKRPEHVDISQPTAMSYSIQRIRLAEISRNIVDRNPLMIDQADGGQSHDVIMDIDTELQLFLDDLPPFFLMPVQRLIEIYQLTPSEASKISQQGYMICSHLYTQRCKLHFPYFSRGFVEPAYATSRDICVQTARQIIQVEMRLECSGLAAATRYKYLGFFLGVFNAIIVLLMDLCHSTSPTRRTKPYKEIADAFKILEEARHESKPAAKVLESLQQLLRKHKLPQPKRSTLETQEPWTINKQPSTSLDQTVSSNIAAGRSPNVPAMLPTPTTPVSLLESNDTNSVATDCGSLTSEANLSSYFNELSQTFGNGLDASSFDWDNICAGLDSSFLDARID